MRVLISYHPTKPREWGSLLQVNSPLDSLLKVNNSLGFLPEFHAKGSNISSLRTLCAGALGNSIVLGMGPSYNIGDNCLNPTTIDGSIIGEL